jgi:hypothetical protein
LDGAVNKRVLSTGETGEFAGENVGFGLNLGLRSPPGRISLPTGEGLRNAKTYAMLWIREK